MNFENLTVGYVLIIFYVLIKFQKEQKSISI